MEASLEDYSVEKKPQRVRKFGQVRKQVSLDDANVTSIWPEFSENIPLNFTPGVSIIKEDQSEFRTTIFQLGDPGSPESSTLTNSPRKKASLNAKRKLWAGLKSTGDSTESNHREAGNAKPNRTLGAKRFSAMFRHNFMSIVNLKWPENVFGRDEPTDEHLTAYTKRLRMMHEKGPFDEIRDDDRRNQWKQRGQRRTFGVCYFALLLIMSLLVSGFLLFTFVPDHSSEQPWNEARLTSNLNPTQYNISMFLEDFSEVFSGSAVITFEVTKNTRYIILHSVGLNVTDVSVSLGFELRLFLVPENDYLVIESKQCFLTLETFQLQVSFSGRVSLPAESKFGAGEPLVGVNRFNDLSVFDSPVYSSYFLAHSYFGLARYLLPCLDEARFRSQFYFDISYPSKYRAVARMQPLYFVQYPSSAINVASYAMPELSGIDCLTFALVPRDLPVHIVITKNHPVQAHGLSLIPGYDKVSNSSVSAVLNMVIYAVNYFENVSNFGCKSDPIQLNFINATSTSNRLILDCINVPIDSDYNCQLFWRTGLILVPSGFYTSDLNLYSVIVQTVRAVLFRCLDVRFRPESYTDSYFESGLIEFYARAILESFIDAFPELLPDNFKQQLVADAVRNKMRFFDGPLQRKFNITSFYWNTYFTLLSYPDITLSNLTHCLSPKAGPKLNVSSFILELETCLEISQTTKNTGSDCTILNMVNDLFEISFAVIEDFSEMKNDSIALCTVLCGISAKTEVCQNKETSRCYLKWYRNARREFKHNSKLNLDAGLRMVGESNFLPVLIKYPMSMYQYYGSQMSENKSEKQADKTLELFDYMLAVDMMILSKNSQIDFKWLTLFLTYYYRVPMKVFSDLQYASVGFRFLSSRYALFCHWTCEVFGDVLLKNPGSWLIDLNESQIMFLEGFALNPCCYNTSSRYSKIKLIDCPGVPYQSIRYDESSVNYVADCCINATNSSLLLENQLLDHLEHICAQQLDFGSQSELIISFGKNLSRIHDKFLFSEVFRVLLNFSSTMFGNQPCVQKVFCEFVYQSSWSPEKANWTIEFFVANSPKYSSIGSRNWTEFEVKLLELCETRISFPNLFRENIDSVLPILSQSNPMTKSWLLKFGNEFLQVLTDSNL